MNTVPPQKQDDIETDTDREMVALAKEMQAKRKEFVASFNKSVSKTEHKLAILKHNMRAANHAISREITNGLKNITAAGKGIVFPSDVV